MEVVDARVETRWPDDTPRAVARGSLSSLSLRLRTVDVRGALNIYAHEPNAFTTHGR